jgi:hypothetical protein
MCKCIYRFSLPLILSVALIVLPAEARAAPDTVCDTFIGPVLIEGKIVVPDGAECNLLGTIVDGSIIVGIASTLIANGIEVIKPGTVNIQAYGATRIEVTGLCKSPPGLTVLPPCVGDPEETLQRSELLGGIQAVAGETVIISDTSLDGAIQILDNSGEARITESFVEGAVQLGKNKDGVSVEASFLGEGIEISETEGDVTFIGNFSDESDLTISKTNGNVTVMSNPSLGENFELSETSGHVTVVNNIINDNAEIFANSNGAIVSGNTVGDNLALAKIDPVTGAFLGIDPLTGLSLGTTGGDLKILGNTVGDNVVILEAGGEVTVAENVVEGNAWIDKTTGRVTAKDNWIGFQPPEPPDPGAEPEVSEVASGGSLSVSEASEGAMVRDNRITDNLEVTENGFSSTTTIATTMNATSVANNTVRVGITVSKNRGGTEVSLNSAGGDIECKDNDPPAMGGGNVAGAEGGSGSLKGECA